MFFLGDKSFNSIYVFPCDKKNNFGDDSDVAVKSVKSQSLKTLQTLLVVFREHVSRHSVIVILIDTVYYHSLKIERRYSVSCFHMKM